MSQNTALIIDDTDANRIFFERLIKQAGFDVVSSANAKGGLSRVMNLDTLPLAIVDMQVPDMNGLEITTRLRTKFPDACIIVATMHDERSLIDSSFSKGCNVFMVKPHGFMELFKRLTAVGVEGLIEAGPMVFDQYGPRTYRPATT